MKKILCHLAVCLSFGLLLVACQVPPTQPSPLTAEQMAADAEQKAADAAALARAAKEQELAQALDLYAQGQFAPAIEALRPLIDAPELSTESQLRAIKFTALSHCIQSQILLCRQFFEQALKLDASFQLADTEASHPVWGAVFKKAQRNNRIASAQKRAAEKTTPLAPTPPRPLHGKD